MKNKTLLALVFIMALTFILTANNAFAATDPAAWKRAYQETIAAEREKTVTDTAPAEAANKYIDDELYYYALYDIDKDGVPEMILHFGFSEAYEFYNVYAYQRGKVVLLHTWPCGGDYLATYPKGNGILRCHARQGYQTVFLWTVSGNSIAESDPIFSEGDVYGSYTAPGEIVSGSTYLNEYPVSDLLPVLLYESWEKDLDPLSAGGKTDKMIPIQYPENDSGFFQKVLNNQIPVIPAKISMKHNEYWPVPDSKGTIFSDYIDYIAQRFGQDAKAQTKYDVFYSDLNGDRQADAACSIHIQNDERYSRAFTIFLCEQSGSVYAYLLDYIPVTGVDTVGVLYSYYEDYGHYEYAFKLFFDKEDSFIVYVPFENYGGQREGKTIIGYNMVHYGTQSAIPPHYRMFRNYSINEAYSEYSARESYGEKHFTRYVDASMLANANTYEPGSLVLGEYAGYQEGTDTAYSFGDDKYVWFIESIVYE